MAKIGRNEPCPCGSGKKYKKCCLNKNQELSTEFIFRKSREIDLEIIDKLRHFVGQHFGPEIIHLAWQDFSGDSKAFFSEDNPHHQLFLPWTLFNWLPAQNDEFDPPQRKNDFTIADFFLDRYSTQLSSLERIYIEQTIKQPFSFYEIIEAEPGRSMTLKNLFWEQKVYVLEEAGTQNLRSGDFLFCRIIEFEGINLMLGSSTIRIPQDYKINLLNIKETILQAEKTLTKNKIQSWQYWLIDAYLGLFNQIMIPPQLVNKDGDELRFCEINYQIEDAMEIWKRLQTLTDITDEEFQLMAEFDAAGNLQNFDFPWLCELLPGESNPSIFAYITLSPAQLTVEVNSEAREEKAKAELSKLLGTKAKFQTTVIKNLDPFASFDFEDSENEAKPLDDKTEEIMAENPEIGELLGHYLQEHWENWIDEKIPALNNITPREAVKTDSGKEKVLALLENAESSSLQNPQMIIQLKYIKETKKKLGLE